MIIQKMILPVLVAIGLIILLILLVPGCATTGKDLNTGVLPCEIN